jgi:two-component sensor histidine kinase
VVNTSLDLERAIPLGLITNELVSNALKYAFPRRRSGVIRVDLEIASEDCYRLIVADDGIGLPDSFDLNQLRSLGLQLTRDLIQQLSGSLTIVHAPGTAFHISFPLIPSEN